MKTSRTLIGALALTATLFVGAACSAEDQANQALKDANIDGNISLDGDLPTDFPKDDVPTPDLKLETGTGIEGTFALRYTSKDARGDVASYKSALAEAGFTITGEVDDLDQPAAGEGHVALTATSADWIVNVSAFGPGAPGGGDYLAVAVTKGI